MASANDTTNYATKWNHDILSVRPRHGADWEYTSTISVVPEETRHRQKVDAEYLYFQSLAKKYKLALRKIRKAAEPWSHEQTLGWIYRTADKALEPVEVDYAI